MGNLLAKLRWKRTDGRPESPERHHPSVERRRTPSTKVVNEIDLVETPTTTQKRERSSSTSKNKDDSLKGKKISKQRNTTENVNSDTDPEASPYENLKHKYSEKRQKLKEAYKVNENVMKKLKSASYENKELQILNRRLQREILDYFEKHKNNLHIASEQPAEDEGTRRDIPEKEYERPSPEQTTEEISKQESISEKVTEAATNSSVIQETKLHESEKPQLSSYAEQKEIPEPISSSVLVQETHPSQTEETKQSISEEQTEVEKESENVEGAVVKIQAGIRGYLTRKTLKEQKENVSSNKNSNIEELSQDDLSKFEIEVTEKKLDEITTTLPEKVILESSVVEVPAESSADDTENVKKAAVKIQSVYRGYITRKNLSNIGDELIEENDIIDQTTKENTEEISSLEKETTPSTIQESEELEDENEGGTLEQAAVKIQSTFRGYQVRKQKKNGPKKEDVKEPLLIDTSEIQNESEKTDTETDNSKAEGKAAVKIQAMYRGYKVRKEIKLIGEDGDELIETIESENSNHKETDFDKNNTFENDNDPNLDESEEEEDEEEEEEEDDGLLKSKTTIILSTPSESKISKSTAKVDDALINFNNDSVPPMASPVSLLDENNEEQCFQKPMVPVSNETTIPKSVSEPLVDLKSITTTKEDHSLSPSSD